MAKYKQQQTKPGPLDRISAIFTGKKPEQEALANQEPPAASEPPSESGLQAPATPPQPEPSIADKARAYMLDRANPVKAKAAGQVTRTDPLPSAVQSLALRKEMKQAVGKRCPNNMCRTLRTRVVQTRTAQEGAVKRERECAMCGHRWWTEEK